jgi:hypothetical protein
MVERDKAFFDLSFGRFVAKPEIGKGVAMSTAATFFAAQGNIALKSG